MSLEEIIVAKFGGSSLATADEVARATDIILSDPRRTRIVLSAPGKGGEYDWKVTDKLKDIVNFYHDNEKYEESQDRINERFIRDISERYKKLAHQLKLLEHDDDKEVTKLINGVSNTTKNRLNKQYHSDKATDSIMRLDAVMSLGEVFIAQVMGLYIDRVRKVKATVLLPENIGIRVSKNFQCAHWHQSSETTIRNLLELNTDIAIIAGYYGITDDSEIATLGRNSTDTVGGIIASSISTPKINVIYENWTDTPGVSIVDPRIMPTAKINRRMIYSEAKELVFLSCGVLHKNAIDPCEKKNIPIIVKSAKNPELPGTIIWKTYPADHRVTGIAHDTWYRNVNVQFWVDSPKDDIDYASPIWKDRVLHHAKGFLLARNIPVTIDSSSHEGFGLLIHEEQLENQSNIINELTSYLHKTHDINPRAVSEDLGYSIVSVVGRGLSGPGSFADITAAMADNGISIAISDQRASELSIFLGFKENAYTCIPGEHTKATVAERAVRAIYSKFHGELECEEFECS